MKGLKPSAALFALTVGSGMLMGSSSLMPFGLGLSLFIPALFIYTYLNHSPILAVISSALAVITVVLFLKEAAADLTSVLLLGPLYLLLRRFGASACVVGGALLITAATVLEEQIFGLPPEVKAELSNLANYRFALYFFSSAVFSTFTYGIVNWLVRELPSVTELRFGFWTVILFTLSAAGTLVGTGTVKTIAINLLIISLTLLIVQGTAVFLHFFPRLSGLWKLIVGLTIFIFPPGFFITALVLGLLDQKFNFRKPTNGGKENGSNPS